MSLKAVAYLLATRMFDRKVEQANWRAWRG